MAKRNANKVTEVDKENIYIGYDHDKKVHEISYNKELTFPNASKFYGKPMINNKTKEISSYGDLFVMADVDDNLYFFPKGMDDIFEKNEVYSVNNWCFQEDANSLDSDNLLSLREELGVIKNAVSDLSKIMGDVLGLVKGQEIKNKRTEMILDDMMYLVKSTRNAVEKLSDRLPQELPSMTHQDTQRPFRQTSNFMNQNRTTVGTYRYGRINTGNNEPSHQNQYNPNGNVNPSLMV